MIYDGFDQLTQVRDDATEMRVDYGYGYEALRTTAMVAATGSKSGNIEIWFDSDESERARHREHAITVGQDPVARVVMNTAATNVSVAGFLQTDTRVHGHLPGTGPGMRGQGPSLDPQGNVVPWNSGAAHWPINQGKPWILRRC
jgi:hypothetical protein